MSLDRWSTLHKPSRALLAVVDLCTYYCPSVRLGSEMHVSAVVDLVSALFVPNPSRIHPARIPPKFYRYLTPDTNKSDFTPPTLQTASCTLYTKSDSSLHDATLGLGPVRYRYLSSSPSYASLTDLSPHLLRSSES
jgi:hypothetical protein